MTRTEIERYLAARTEYRRACEDMENCSSERATIDNIVREGRLPPARIGKVLRLLAFFGMVELPETRLPRARLDELEERLKYLDVVCLKIEEAKKAYLQEIRSYAPDESDTRLFLVLDSIGRLERKLDSLATFVHSVSSGKPK